MKDLLFIYFVHLVTLDQADWIWRIL
jgi:hypothetical protein